MRYDTHELPTTVDEYLRWEEQSAIRHEYVVGHVYAMSGGTKRHNLITLNIASALRGRVRQLGCQVFVTDIKLKVAEDRYYYPDVAVACGRAADFDETMTQPSLVVEVTSKSTRRNDNHEKLDAYKGLPSLRAYLIVDQRRKHVIQISRSASGDWDRAEITEGDIALDFLGYTLSIDEIYDDVTLPPMSVGEEDESDTAEDDVDDVY